jgi:Na+-driven multidrug efflux pump
MQAKGAMISFVGNYLVCIPLAVGLGLRTNLEVAGMWLALLIAYSLEFELFLIIFWRMDWRDVAR